MLANRADTYNLGDIIGGSAEWFKASYLENAVTSNAVLAPLAVPPMERGLVVERRFFKDGQPVNSVQVGDIVNPVLRPAGILIPSGEGPRRIQAGFNQIEAGVIKAAGPQKLEIDGLVDEQADPMQSVALREFMQKVAQLIPQLPLNQQLVLALHYQEEWSYSEIADSLQLTRGRISQLHTAAIQTLRSLMLEQNRPASGPKPLA